MTERACADEFRRISKEYAYSDDVFCEDDQKVKILKQIISEKLCQVDRIIILLYADCASYRKLGEKMGMAPMTIRKQVIRIQDIIKKEYERTIAHQCPGDIHC